MATAQLDSPSSNGRLILLTPATSSSVLLVVGAAQYFWGFFGGVSSLFSPSQRILFIAELLQKASRVLSPFYEQEIQGPL